MGNLLTVADRINEALNSGKVPNELSNLTGPTAKLAAGVQQAKITDASTAHVINATFTNTEVQTALNALGTKINVLIDALEAFKISTP